MKDLNGTKNIKKSIRNNGFKGGVNSGGLPVLRKPEV